MSTPALTEPDSKRPGTSPEAKGAVMAILAALSISHFLNDSIQALIPSIYPLLKRDFSLTFSQVGLITFTFQMAGSIFQPVVGHYTDRNPKPYSLALGMCVTMTGLVVLAFAPSYHAVILAAGLVGLGSAVFHPESSRMARLASGGRPGFAQSVFQVGGNAGTSLGPLLAAWIIVPRGQRYILCFTVLAFTGIIILSQVGRWYAGRLAQGNIKAVQRPANHVPLPTRTVRFAIGILLVLIFSKFFYLSSMTSYYTLYLIKKFGVSIQTSQVYLFIFLFAVASGTFIGGPMGDRFGRKRVIWISILGIAPFSLMLPHANLLWTSILSVVIGVMMASAFPAILVYATELVPGRVGLVAGLFFGFAFGMAGIGAAVLGKVADLTSIGHVYQICAFLPLIGIIAGLLPDLDRHVGEDEIDTTGPD